MTTLDAVIFDFDGVILDSAAIKTQAFAALFADRPAHVEAVVALHLANEGVSRHRKFEIIHRDILAEPLDDVRRRALAERFEDLVRDAVVNAPFIPGAEATLASLAGRLPLFVASGTPHDELAWIVRERNLARYFVETIGSPPAKADQLADILARHSLAPSRVLMVGDALTDLQAARANQTRFVGIGAAAPTGKFPPDVPTLNDMVDFDRYLESLE